MFAVWGGDHVLGAGGDPEGPHRHPRERTHPRWLQEKLDAVLPQSEERAWFRQRLLPLLGIEATSSAEREELFTAWRRFLEGVAEERPTVLVFEDLHWADEAMLAFLEHLADLAEGVPLLIVGTARPELYERYPALRGRDAEREDGQPGAAVAGGDGPSRLGPARCDGVAGGVAAADPRPCRWQPVVRGGVRPPVERQGSARAHGPELAVAGGCGGAVPRLGAGPDRGQAGHPRCRGEVLVGGRGRDREGVLGGSDQRDG